ncbi:DUF456 domain-containing protein [Brevibacterium samyangense]|uniref:DUF456 domain-containing protein n=1 Tax=Brevibacterium samyangense TaxID=366888 RepID=A0ABN2T7J8_9MICO
MTADIIATVLAGIAILVGCVGIVVPILPGSILIGLAALVWAFFIGGATGWVTFGIIAVLVAIGMSASWVLTGKKLKERDIPNRSLLLGGLLAVVGFFVVPVVGLLLGFVGGLYLAEYLRLREARTAWDSSWTAIKAAGVGIVVEFSCAALATGAFAVANGIHYLNV